MAAACRRCWAWHSVGQRLVECSEKLEVLMITVKISLTIYMYKSKDMTTFEQLLWSLAVIRVFDFHCYLGQRPKIDDRLSIRTTSCAKLQDDGGGSKVCYEFVRLDWMLRRRCRKSIFVCHSHVIADIQVLEVDAGYKIRYNEVSNPGHFEVSKGRKM